MRLLQHAERRLGPYAPQPHGGTRIARQPTTPLRIEVEKILLPSRNRAIVALAMDVIIELALLRSGLAES